VNQAKSLLDAIGLGGDRLEIFFMSGGQGHTFAMCAQKMVDRIRALGPNPLKRPQVVQVESVEKPTDEDAGFRRRRLPYKKSRDT
jgi:hypothetical protein